MYTGKIPVSCYITRCTDPYRNLASERYLLEHTPAGSVTLYLWQNKNTVVIGRNQNPWAECNMALLRQDGGHLVRRLSGGGAVYHDSGNLNFTFLTDAATYNLDRQLAVIITALASLGIKAEKSGRNDILVDGRKVSGNAFYTSGNKKYHHGTLLIDVKTDVMAKYLTVSPLKLQAKGVSSVKSRVLNLKEACPTLTVAALSQALITAFGQIYNSVPQELGADFFDEAELAKYEAEFRDDAFRLGKRLPFTWQTETRFDWGSFTLACRIDGGIVQQAEVYTDAMDWQALQNAGRCFTGTAFTPQALAQAARQIPGEAGTDIAEFLAQLSI